MSLRLFTAIAALTVFFSSAAYAGFDEGKAAYESQNWREAIVNLRPLAENGDGRALVLLGNMYSQGYGVQQDPVEAFISYRRAASLGNADGMLAVATLYQKGIGVQVNDPLAFKWFERAAKSGNQAGAFFYAIFLFQGSKGDTFDIKPDHPESYKWFRIAQKGTAFPDISKAGEAAAKMVAKKLIPEEIEAADKAVAAWKPAAFADLGPAPDGLKEPIVEGEDFKAQLQKLAAEPAQPGNRPQPPAKPALPEPIDQGMPDNRR